MSLENPNTVDAIGIEGSSDLTVLTIADSWDWANERSHLSALQDKLNSYFEFIESGQIWESYPAAKGRQIAIDIVSRFDLPASAETLVAKASEVALQLDVKIRHRIFSASPESEV